MPGYEVIDKKECYYCPNAKNYVPIPRSENVLTFSIAKAKGGLMDKIGGFTRGLGGAAVGAMMGKFSGGSVSGEDLLSGEPSVKLESCDPAERPAYPKGPDGCG